MTRGNGEQRCVRVRSEPTMTLWTSHSAGTENWRLQVHGTCIAACSHRMKLYYQRLVQESWNSEAPVAPPHRGRQQALSPGAISAMSLLHCGDAESRSYTAEYTLIASRDAFMAAKTLQRAGAVARAAYVLLRTQRTKQDEQTTTTTDCNNDLPSSGKHDTMSCGMGAR